MRKLYAKVVERVNPQEDDVRFYGISEEAVSRVLVIGENRCTLSPTPKTPILWLRCVDCSPRQGSTLWYRDFYPPHYHLFTLWIAGASIWVSVFPSR